MAPKAEIKQEKKDYVKHLAENLKSAKSAVFVNYSGMNVSSQEALRSKLNEKGGKMLVAKNTLVKIALKDAGMNQEGLDDVLEGQTALVLAGEDAVSPIQALGKYFSEFEMPEVKAGFIDGQFYDKDKIIKISKLPSKEQLYAQAVGAVSAPLYGLVGTLQANMQKLVFILDQARTQRG